MAERTLVLNLVCNKWAKEFKCKCSGLGIFAELVLCAGPQQMRSCRPAKSSQAVGDKIRSRKLQGHQHFDKRVALHNAVGLEWRAVCKTMQRPKTGKKMVCPKNYKELTMGDKGEW